MPVSGYSRSIEAETCNAVLKSLNSGTQLVVHMRDAHDTNL